MMSVRLPPTYMVATPSSQPPITCAIKPHQIGHLAISLGNRYLLEARARAAVRATRHAWYPPGPVPPLNPDLGPAAIVEQLVMEPTARCRGVGRCKREV